MSMMTRRATTVLTTIVAVTLGGARADAETSRTAEPAQWLTGLTDRVVEDLTAGRPMVVQIHAPLCDASIIPCGNAKLGDGESLATNLYWATTPGFGHWFTRRGGGWTRALSQRGHDTGDDDILAIDVYRRAIATPAAWTRRGAPKRFPLYLVVVGWRGPAIDRALAAFTREASGLDPRTLDLKDAHGDPLSLQAGGAAHLVAYSGHNRFMDVEDYTWPPPSERPIGVIAVACMTASYMEASVPAATRVPLLMTRDYLFANAAPVEAAALAFARGADYAAIRSAAASAYADVQKKEAQRVLYAFTNPADRRWRRPR
jgi:hypothetical protein